ncbi:MAG: hypothetical protein N2561_06960 [Bacteroidetes bacterium]|nr:hypothetical protein [Rhodothermia bacterium]MCS7154976.1 hypothetical protein [Bacteroidota bacterium]MCX7907260.1 hypothetical protein [Bacteroidota bacterium]MDW8138014.1 hypothetical protein [Bacteroidota bacterium]MDW8286134.1 hypothetical protein [Bacteroidota bacterium]
MIYERRRDPPLPRMRFLMRMLWHASGAALLVGAALGLGMWGYRVFVGLDWVDAFLNAAMILGGMGPVAELRSPAAKIFAGCYALFSGLLFLVTAAVLLSPLVHRFLHAFHWDPEEEPPNRARSRSDRGSSG